MATNGSSKAANWKQDPYLYKCISKHKEQFQFNNFPFSTLHYLTVYQCVAAHWWKNTDMMVHTPLVLSSTTRGSSQTVHVLGSSSEYQAHSQECETDMQQQ